MKSMNCLWIILLLSCFGGCNNNGGRSGNCGCSNNGGRSGNCCDNDDCGGRDGQRNRCRRAVEKAVDECGSERAVMRALRDRDGDCKPEKPGCPEAREERAERRMERMADNNSCDVPGMNPPHWQDFPEVSRSSSREDCGCDS